MLIKQITEIDNLSSETQPTVINDTWSNPWILGITIIVLIALMALIIFGIRMLLAKQKPNPQPIPEPINSKTNTEPIPEEDKEFDELLSMIIQPLRNNYWNTHAIK